LELSEAEGHPGVHRTGTVSVVKTKEADELDLLVIDSENFLAALLGRTVRIDADIVYERHKYPARMVVSAELGGVA
jgi:hypothetical protein